MKVKEENEKAGLKHSIQKMKIMESGFIISQQIDTIRKHKHTRTQKEALSSDLGGGEEPGPTLWERRGRRGGRGGEGKVEEVQEERKEKERHYTKQKQSFRDLQENV